MVAMTWLAAAELATVAAQFRPLDSSVVSEAIPAFFVGRNKEGFWIARDVNGQIGGIFLLESSATCFARRNSRPAGCATIYPSERFELDIENKGNPLVRQLGYLLRLTRTPRRGAAACIGAMRDAIKYRLGLRRLNRRAAKRRDAANGPAQ